MAETVEVPFVTIGNRRGLTYQQMMQYPHLRDFYNRFKSSFEVCLNADAVLLIEPENPPTTPTGSE